MEGGWPVVAKCERIEARGGLGLFVLLGSPGTMPCSGHAGAIFEVRERGERGEGEGEEEPLHSSPNGCPALLPAPMSKSRPGSGHKAPQATSRTIKRKRKTKTQNTKHKSACFAAFWFWVSSGGRSSTFSMCQLVCVAVSGC